MELFRAQSWTDEQAMENWGAYFIVSAFFIDKGISPLRK